jgi:hypothetical protein
MIGSLQAISPKSPEDEERIKQEIAALVNKKRYLITNPNSLGTSSPLHYSRSSRRGVTTRLTRLPSLSAQQSRSRRRTPRARAPRGRRGRAPSRNFPATRQAKRASSRPLSLMPTFSTGTACPPGKPLPSQTPNWPACPTTARSVRAHTTHHTPGLYTPSMISLFSLLSLSLTSMLQRCNVNDHTFQDGRC